ncbi:hypothetical protein [Brenneria rubrifaciens]|uniref:Integrase n=1 Tax=Brenneria rubrifaciens TaxID=55213 RepID=A0A4P8QRD9_9GAMM|nr:hypothetical protein [Brenneria rubrifaciens]QCR09697.1 hypothetical protein EH207_14890 [Brenneria rubrifaciens]
MSGLSAGIEHQSAERHLARVAVAGSRLVLHSNYWLGKQKRFSLGRYPEIGYPKIWIEAQLPHVDPNKVSAAYNQAQYVEQRRGMMQAWAAF